MVAAAITLARPNGDIVVSPGWRQACGDPSSAAHRAASAEVLGGTSLSATRSHTFVGAPPTVVQAHRVFLGPANTTSGHKPRPVLRVLLRMHDDEAALQCGQKACGAV